MKTRFLILMIIGICIRLVLAYFFYGNYDQESYQVVADIVRSGGNVYAKTERYNYAPTWSFILTALSFIQIPFQFAVRSLLTLVDIFLAILIIKISGKEYLGILFFLNPVSILITGYHGQFDNLAVLPLLIAVIIQKRNGSSWSIFLLGTLSILIKHITIFAVIAIFFSVTKHKRRAILMLLGSALIFLISFLPYIPEGSNNILHRVFLYSGTFKPYSPFLLIPFWTTPLFAIVMLMFIYLFRKKPIENQIQNSFLVFLTFAPGISEQYFVLPVIIGSLFPKFGYYLFSIITFIFLMGSENNLSLPIPSTWFSVWIAVLIWLINSSGFILRENKIPND